MSHWTQEDVPPGRDVFWRENAVALLSERDAKIARLRARITKLEKGTKGLRGEIVRLQRIIDSLAAPCYAQSEALELRAMRMTDVAQDDDTYDDDEGDATP